MPELSRADLSLVLEKLQLDGELPLVGCITRFHREKGSHYLPEIISRVVNKKPQVKFILVGDGPFRSSLAAEIRKRQLEGAVRFTGFQPDIAKYISLLDVFFLPSREESFPQALLEALGAGVPSACTDVGGVREIITPGETGLLVKPGDPGAMADAILWLLDHNEAAQKMSEQGKKIVKRNFQLDDKIRQIKDIYG
jgi:glycosyltransferase involved in cell wall biosynthesis